jgi:hypothetical protein
MELAWKFLASGPFLVALVLEAIRSSRKTGGYGFGPEILDRPTVTVEHDGVKWGLRALLFSVDGVSAQGNKGSRDADQDHSRASTRPLNGFGSSS